MERFVDSEVEYGGRREWNFSSVCVCHGSAVIYQRHSDDKGNVNSISNESTWQSTITVVVVVAIVIFTALTASKYATSCTTHRQHEQECVAYSLLIQYFVVLCFQLYADQTSHSFTELSMSDGDIYRATVTTCNRAGLCTNSTSSPILVR